MVRQVEPLSGLPLRLSTTSTQVPDLHVPVFPLKARATPGERHAAAVDLVVRSGRVATRGRMDKSPSRPSNSSGRVSSLAAISIAMVKKPHRLHRMIPPGADGCASIGRHGALCGALVFTDIESLSHVCRVFITVNLFPYSSGTLPFIGTLFSGSGKLPADKLGSAALASSPLRLCRWPLRPRSRARPGW